MAEGVTQGGTPPVKKGALDRFLGLFTDVQGGEGGRALLLTLNVFLILTAYYLLKVVREPLIQVGAGAFGLEGAKLKNAASAAQAVLLLGIVPLYANLASRVSRTRLINIVTAIFVACLIGFYFAAGRVPIGLAFYIWMGIFNLMVIAQFWSFANDVYRPDEGKRLFAIVAFGQTSGAIVGSVLAAWLIPIFGEIPLMLIAAGLLIPGVVITNIVSAQAHATPQQAGPPKSSTRGGFTLVFKSRYLLLIAFMLLVYNLVNTNGEYILGETLVHWAKAHDPTEAGQKAIVGTFYGGFFAAQNILTVVIQLFLVSRIIKYFGVRIALLVMPFISLVGYGLIAAVPLLALIRVIKIAENATDYSIQNTTRQALFLPTSRAEKYQAKAAIDTFFVRFGDVASFGVVALAAVALGMGVKAMAIINMGFVLVWIVLAIFVGKHHARLDSKAEKSADTK